MTPPDRNAPSEVSTQKKRYGLIAGWGNYPIVLAQALKESGHEVVCLGALGHANPKLREICDIYRPMGIAKFGVACRFFRKQGVTEATMAGKIFKKRLLQPGFIWRQLPDLYTISTFFPHFLSKKTDLKDDSLLLTVTRAFEEKGIHLLAGTDLAPNLLVRRGLLTKKGLTESDWNDVRLAWPLTREIGRLDFGQDVMVKNQTILAVEGIDGTDETMRRAGRLNQEKGFAVIKIGKPNQDMRFDVPTVGFGTLETMAASGANVLAIESGKTLCVEPQEAFAKKADSLGIAVVALDETDLASPTFPTFKPISDAKSVTPTEKKAFNISSPTLTPLSSPLSSPSSFEIRLLTKRNLSPSQRKDILFGWPITEALAQFGVGQTVTVRERAILAVESAEGRIETARRTQTLAKGFSILLNAATSPTPEPINRHLLVTMIETRSNLLAVSEDYPFLEKKRILAAADRLHLTIVEIVTPPPKESPDKKERFFGSVR